MYQVIHKSFLNSLQITSELISIYILAVYAKIHKAFLRNFRRILDKLNWFMYNDSTQTLYFDNFIGVSGEMSGDH